MRWCKESSFSFNTLVLLTEWKWSHSVVSDSLQPCGPTRLLRLWDSPGKNIGAGCHFLLQLLTKLCRNFNPFNILLRFQLLLPPLIRSPCYRKQVQVLTNQAKAISVNCGAPTDPADKHPPSAQGGSQVVWPDPPRGAGPPGGVGGRSFFLLHRSRSALGTSSTGLGALPRRG